MVGLNGPRIFNLSRKNCFPKWLYDCTSSPTLCGVRAPAAPRGVLAPGVLSLLNVTHSNGSVGVSYDNAAVHLPNDFGW